VIYHRPVSCRISRARIRCLLSAALGGRCSASCLCGGYPDAHGELRWPQGGRSCERGESRERRLLIGVRVCLAVRTSAAALLLGKTSVDSGAVERDFGLRHMGDGICHPPGLVTEQRPGRWLLFSGPIGLGATTGRRGMLLGFAIASEFRRGGDPVSIGAGVSYVREGASVRSPDPRSGLELFSLLKTRFHGRAFEERDFSGSSTVKGRGDH